MAFGSLSECPFLLDRTSTLPHVSLMVRLLPQQGIHVSGVHLSSCSFAA